MSDTENGADVPDAGDQAVDQKQPEPEPDAGDAPAEEEEPAPDLGEAPYGWDVLGKDGRRILRGVPEPEARRFAGELKSKTGERLKVKPSTAPLLGPATPADAE